MAAMGRKHVPEVILLRPAERDAQREQAQGQMLAHDCFRRLRYMFSHDEDRYIIHPGHSD